MSPAVGGIDGHRNVLVLQMEAGDFERMSDEELRKYVYDDDELPPKGPKGPVKH
jgi:hypothetical protein